MFFVFVFNRFFELERYVFSYTNETMVGMTELRKDPLYNTIYLVKTMVEDLKKTSTFIEHIV
jgi:hypothetical protein